MQELVGAFSRALTRLGVLLADADLTFDGTISLYSIQVRPSFGEVMRALALAETFGFAGVVVAFGDERVRIELADFAAYVAGELSRDDFRARWERWPSTSSFRSPPNSEPS